VKARTVTGAAVAVAKANRRPRALLQARQAIRRVAIKRAAIKRAGLDRASRGVAAKGVAAKGVAIRRAAIKRVVRVASLRAAVGAMIGRIGATIDRIETTDMIGADEITIAIATTNR
jgi:hypothetical protein